MSTNLLHSLGLAIRARREARGISQEALGEVAGMHRTYVGGVERGERNLTFLSLVEIASALGVSASQLVAEAEELLRSTTAARE